MAIPPIFKRNNINKTDSKKHRFIKRFDPNDY